MANLKPVPEEVGDKFSPLPTGGDGGLDAYKQATDRRLQEMETLTKAVLFIAVVTVVGLVVAVSGLILDQLHFNNQFYQNGYNLPKQTKTETKTIIKPVFVKSDHQ